MPEPSAASSACGARLSESGSTSTSTGESPAAKTAVIVATKVHAGISNSCTTGKIEAPERDFERGGARRRRDGVIRAEVVRQLLLEGPALEAGREPSAAQHAHHGVNVLVADAGIHELQRLHHGLGVPHVVHGALEGLDLAMKRRARGGTSSLAWCGTRVGDDVEGEPRQELDSAAIRALPLADRRRDGPSLDAHDPQRRRIDVGGDLACELEVARRRRRQPPVVGVIERAALTQDVLFS